MATSVRNGSAVSDGHALARTPGHRMAVRPSLIGSPRGSLDARPVRGGGPAGQPAPSTERARPGHNSRTRTTSPRVRSGHGGPGLTPPGHGGIIRARRLTPAGADLVALVPDHDHSGRLCAVCLTAKLATTPALAPRARVVPADVLHTLDRERGNVTRTARLHGISERHVRRIRAGFRPAGAADADAIAAVIREDGGELTRASVLFGISHRHAQRIRNGWRPGGRHVEAIPWASRGYTHQGQSGVGGSAPWNVAQRARNAQRDRLAADTRMAEAEAVGAAAAAVLARAQRVRDLVRLAG